MADNIATVLIPVPVIRFNNTTYIQDGQLVPQTLNVPCREVLVDTPNWWAVPIKDSGIFTTLEFIPKTDVNGIVVAQPTFDSFTVTRVRDKLRPNYTWWVVINTVSPGGEESFINACSTCCGDEFTPLTGEVPLIVPCQLICNSTNGDGDFISVFGAPALGEGESYVAHGAYNNEALNDVTGTTIDNLIINLNNDWGTIGSPAGTFVWTNNGTTITATGGNEGDELCVLIETFID